MSEINATRSHASTIRRRAVKQPLVALVITAAVLMSALTTIAPAGAAVSNQYGASADTEMACIIASGNKFIQVAAPTSRGYDYAAIYVHSSFSGTGYWASGWVAVDRLGATGVSPFANGQTAVIVKYADWTSAGWVYSVDIATRVDGTGYWC